MNQEAQNVDRDEIARFEALAEAPDRPARLEDRPPVVVVLQDVAHEQAGG